VYNPLVSAVLDWLNRYSNLLLVVITGFYVVLTWKNLKAFQRSTLQEREAKHLDDIKARVAEPIVEWINEVLEIPEGRKDLVVIRDAAPGTQPQRPFQLYPIVLPENLNFSKELYIDAAKEHFQKQLAEFETFRRMVEKLLSDFAEFGRNCCDELWRKATLPPPKVNDRSERFADYELIVKASLRYLVLGLKPDFSRQGVLQGTVAVRTGYADLPIANDYPAEIEEWLPRVIEYIDKRWKDSDFRGRLTSTRSDAEHVRASVRDIQLTYVLPNPCKYVGR
jgi:hypothetical protein